MKDFKGFFLTRHPNLNSNIWTFSLANINPNWSFLLEQTHQLVCVKPLPGDAAKWNHFTNPQRLILLFRFKPCLTLIPPVCFLGFASSKNKTWISPKFSCRPGAADYVCELLQNKSSAVLAEVNSQMFPVVNLRIWSRSEQQRGAGNLKMTSFSLKT